jgi:multiple sugar transport system permease protein
MVRNYFASDASRRYIATFWLVLPAVIGLVLFHYWPMYEGLRMSFSTYRPFTGESEWVGLRNYITASGDTVLIRSLGITALYFALKVPFQMMLGLGLALFVSRPLRGVGLLRTLILLPTITSMVVVSLIWGIMYNPTNGLLNSALVSLGLPAQPFLTSPTQALASIAALDIWKDIGLTMLFYLAGLMAISGDYYEAAKVDGANGWQSFRFITLPLLKGTHLFVLLTSTISAFKVFVPVRVLTGGGPSNSTNVIVMYIYDLAFRFTRLDYAATLSVILALILLAISLFQMRVARDNG